MHSSIRQQMVDYLTVYGTTTSFAATDDGRELAGRWRRSDNGHRHMHSFIIIVTSAPLELVPVGAYLHAMTMTQLARQTVAIS